MVEGLKIYLFLFLCKCVPACVYVHRVCTVTLLELAFRALLSHHMNAGKWTWILCKSSKYSCPIEPSLLTHQVSFFSFSLVWLFFFLNSFICLQISRCHLKRYLFYILNIVSLPSLFPVLSTPPTPIHSSSISLQKMEGLPWRSTKHGISSCSKLFTSLLY